MWYNIWENFWSNPYKSAEKILSKIHEGFSKPIYNIIPKVIPGGVPEVEHGNLPKRMLREFCGEIFEGMYEGSHEEIPQRVVGKISKVTDREAYEKNLDWFKSEWVE